jgi:hypothetical protein
MMKIGNISHLIGLLLGLQVQSSFQQPTERSETPVLPTREIAGVTVIDTPIVRAADAFARQYSTDSMYGHVVRSWLFGALIISANDTLAASIDLEIHAVAALLHDLGLDMTPNSPHISPEGRFEVDGAISAREFIRGHEDGQHWEERRVQLVWDAIALHTEGRINAFKELDVQVLPLGVNMDFFGPAYGVSQKDHDAVVEVYPKTGQKSSVNGAMAWLCQTKPKGTYGNYALL